MRLCVLGDCDNNYFDNCVMKKYLSDIIVYLEKHDPYPLDVFPEPSDEDWNNLGNFLQMHGKNPDRIFAKFGRMVRQAVIEDIEQFL